MNFKAIVGLVALGVAFSASAFEVKNVAARQRWPWNSLIDLDFVIEQASADGKFSVGITATCDGDTRTIVGKTYRSDIICGAGQNRLVWDVGADAPGLKTTDLRISVTATPFAANAAAYCVIDLSAGPNAEQYPIRYTLEGPGHEQGAAGETCQMTEMWLKRVSASTYAFHSTDTVKAGWFKAKLTKDYYCGLFECTQQQWYQVMGTWPSRFSNVEYRPSRPVERVTLTTLIGQTQWPDDKTIGADSFVGKIRARTGLKAFNLPTEAQWEWASRGGKSGSIYANATTSRYKATSGTVSSYADADVTVGTAWVGSYAANAWGFYDTLGNVAEWTLDTYVGETALKALYADEIADPGYVTDPEGPANTDSADNLHVVKGGNYASNTGGDFSSTVFAREEIAASASADVKIGARFVVTCE